MNLGIAGKKVLITGAAQGLGRATALQLAEEGARVAVVDKNKDELDKLKTSLLAFSDQNILLNMDLMEAGAVDGMFNLLDDACAWPDIIVHNLGGTLGIRDHLSGMEDFMQVIRFNLGVSIDINKQCIPEMIKRRWGRVVHISSSSAVSADASLPYSVAKAAVNNYVKGLSKKVAADGIVVSSVMPGPFFSRNGHWDMVRREKPDVFEQFLNNNLPAGRMVSAEEISPMIVFLCSEQAAACYGSVMPVDGGIKA